MSAILPWWLVLQIIGLVGLPITVTLFRSLPDHGYAFSKTLGLLLVSYGAWLLAMLGVGSFGTGILLLVIIGAIALDVWLVRSWLKREGAPKLGEFLRDWFKRNWLGLLGYELLFLGALLFLAFVRSHDLGFIGPNPWGTERPMDLAFFNAIQNSPRFPPVDPWLSGYSINYYYFGYMFMSTLALLSGQSNIIGYNLSLCTVYGLAALNIAALLVNLLRLTRQSAKQEQESREAGDQEKNSSHVSQPSSSSASPAWSRLFVPFVVLFGVIGVLLMGNQAGALQMLSGDYRIVALDMPQFFAVVPQFGAPKMNLPYAVDTGGEFGKLTELSRDEVYKPATDGNAATTEFNWWWPSRVVWDKYPLDDNNPSGDVRISYTITEFPWFSFWLGDMHPHVMSLPFTLLSLALVLATIARKELPPFAQGREGWLELLLSGLILGSLYTINSWDLPTYILLYTVALLILAVRLNAGTWKGLPWRALGLRLGMLLIALWALYIPFHLTFRSLVGGGDPLTTIPILSQLSRVVSIFDKPRTELHSFLIIFGLFLIPLIFFVTRWAAYIGTKRNERPTSFLALLFSPWFVLILFVLGMIARFPLLTLVGLAVCAFAAALRRSDRPAEAFVCLLVGIGSLICFGTELIYIRDVFSNRMNSIFKFYYQTWLLWGVVAAYAVWWLWQYDRAVRRWSAIAASLLVLVFFVGGAVYPWMTISEAMEKGKPVGLEGTIPRESSPAGRASIEWLRKNVRAGSVVLEMVGQGGGSYSFEGHAGVSAATGLPTVLGWGGHESQWRGGDKGVLGEIQPRHDAVDEIYSTTDENRARELLKKYNVRYVYIGQLERDAYSAEALAKFDHLGTQVFQQDEVAIYELPK